MSNVALNKLASANNSVAPYSPSRAVDGNLTFTNRWVGSVVPGWLSVDLQTPVWINRWVVSFMGTAGWSVNYNVCDFKLQVSNDNVNWTDADTVTNNSLNKTDRTFPARFARYARVYITKGLRNNNKVSSILELELYDTPGPSLTSLVPSLGILSPAFASGTLNYTMNVANTVGSIKFTPTALQSNMPIKVNGTSVTSGQASQTVNLAIGNNNVAIEVKSADGSITSTYVVNVVRAGASTYLSALSIQEENLEIPVTLNPSFKNTTLSYTSTVNSDYTSIRITPATLDPTATLKVNNVVVPNGQMSGSITLNNGLNTINIQVITSGGLITTYSVNITKTT